MLLHNVPCLWRLKGDFITGVPVGGRNLLATPERLCMIKKALVSLYIAHFVTVGLREARDRARRVDHVP